MNKIMKICLAICLWGMILQGSAQTQIAFISDAHIQDVDGHAERVRSMEAQVQSTRLFNENYYVFLADDDTECIINNVPYVTQENVLPTG